jgi:four helix bundle protein
MYERFTDRARKVMALANQEAQRFNHEYIGTEHILLGLVKEGSGVGATVLKNLGANLPTLRAEVEKLVRSGPDMITAGKLPQTPRAKRVIEYAIEEARALNHNYVGTEHILLGLIREGDGIAAQVLTNLGFKVEDVRREVLKLLGVSEEQEPPESPGLQMARPDTGAAEPSPANYRDMPVWQKADELAHRVYAVTGTFPTEEIYGVASRLRETALSIPPSIAEAHGRRNKTEARWFLNTALSSLQEVRYLLDFSLKIEHLKMEDHQTLKDIAAEVDKQLRVLHASLAC